MERGTRTRVTTGEGDQAVPIWSPDGQTLAFDCDVDLCRVSIDGATKPERLVGRAASPTAWSPDGRTIAYQVTDPKTGRDIGLVEPGRKPTTFLATPFNESGAVFSPSGRYLAYVSDESGRFEVYVMPAAGGAGKWLVSTNGGAEPTWSRDGGEMFYREGDALMSVPVRTDPVFKAGVPRRLFEGRFDVNDNHRHYDVHGARFIRVQDAQRQAPAKLHLILNFTAGLNPGTAR